MLFLKSPVKNGGMLFLLAESLQFPSLVPGLDSHGHTGVRITLRLLYTKVSTYYLEDSTFHCNRHRSQATKQTVLLHINLLSVSAPVLLSSCAS